MEPLTPREWEIAIMVTRGMSRKGIADALGLNVGTVDAHIQNAAGKLPGDGSPKIRLVIFVLSIRQTA